jgi:transcriptional antiterminator NusG
MAKEKAAGKEKTPETKPRALQAKPEMTPEELAALDAEIAAQLDAEAAGMAAQAYWYVVHSYSGMENKVKKNIEHRAESMGMVDRILDVVVPTETEIEIRSGARREVERRVFPGYILVKMIMDEDSWYVVRNSPGVTGFVGMGNKPTPLSEEEVSKIMQRIESDAPRLKINFQVGERVRIMSGPFAEFSGVVEEVDPDKGKAKVVVSFFNRDTPVEVDFLQLEKDTFKQE